MEEAAWGELLGEGELELLGRMPWSSNATFLVVVRGDGIETKAIYKPARGERPLWDFPDGIYRREVAAYELSAATGVGLVPHTVLRADAPYGEGSLQRFVEADYEEHYFTLLEDEEHWGALELLCAFDVVANNADRKGGHVLKDASGRIWGIDHGLCFHVEPKLRTVIWDFAGDALSPAVAAFLEAAAALDDAALGGLLDPDERAALRARARRLERAGRFPAPDPNRRTHPGPLG